VTDPEPLPGPPALTIPNALSPARGEHVGDGPAQLSELVVRNLRHFSGVSRWEGLVSAQLGY